MSRFKFASVFHPNDYGYALDTEAWHDKPEVHSHFQMFQTYGDGLTQHSREWPITKEFLSDFLASLAKVMLEGNDENLIQRVSYDIMAAPTAEEIAFAASVVFKETDGDFSKRRYYSMEQKRIAKGKQHDRRYEEIESWHTGEPDALYRMLIPEYAGGMQMYSYTEAIRNWSLKQGKAYPHYFPLPAIFLKWTKDQQAARDLMHAYRACYNICRAYQIRSEAETHLRNIHPPAPKAEEQEVA